MISHLEIKNFRSIKALELDAKGLCALTGPNSVGKTNVLKAIDLVLGEGWTTKAKVARELFNDTSQPLTISVDLKTAIPFQPSWGGPKNIRKITLEMTLEPLHCDVKLWESYPTDNNGKGVYISEDFKKSCHFIYIPASRRLSDELRVSNWSMLGKLMRQVFDNYVSVKGGEDSLKAEFEDLMKPPKNFLEADFDAGVTFHKFRTVFERYCLENSVGLADKVAPKLNIYDLNWFYKTLQLHVKENGDSKDFNSTEVGTGLQNVLMLSIFQTYAELVGGQVIFGIEEPEIFLYPSAQRSLFDSFKKLSEKSQIFYTTHSPNFIDVVRAHEIEVLRKDSASGTVPLLKNELVTEEWLAKAEFKIYTQFNTHRNELFFAKKVLLVEGASDKILFSTLAKERWGVDLDRSGIVVIDCGGKSGVNYFSGVCNLMGFTEVFAVWDQDAKEYKPAGMDHLPALVTAGTGIEIPENLEKFLKIPQGDKVANAYYWAANPASVIPAQFATIQAFLAPPAIAAPATASAAQPAPAVPPKPSDDDIPF